MENRSPKNTQVKPDINNQFLADFGGSMWILCFRYWHYSYFFWFNIAKTELFYHLKAFVSLSYKLLKEYRVWRVN